MKKSITLLFFVVSGCSVHSVYLKEGIVLSDFNVPRDSIAHTLFFIGDAGAPSESGQEPVLSILADSASINADRNTIIFLGDNIYPAGLPDSVHSDRKEMERRLNEQIAVGERSRSHTIFVPGNHDWERQGKNGLTTLRRQEAFVKGRGSAHISFLPSDGFPGPAVVDIGDDIRLIIIDSQWWLHAYEKPLFTNTTNERESKRLLLDSLSRALTTHRKAVVVAHHPLESHGEHGGFFDWRDHFFPLRHFSPYAWIPLPGIGSLYPLSRQWGITDQDFAGGRYAEFRFAMDSVLSRRAPVAYVSGHEHTLQVLEPRSGYYHIISGFGMNSHRASLTTGENTMFARLAPGFMTMEFLKDGLIYLRVFEAPKEGRSATEIFSYRLR